MKKLTVILLSIFLALAMLNGCMKGRANPSSTINNQESVFISPTKCSLIDDPISTKELEEIADISPSEVVWLTKIDGRYYGVGFFEGPGVIYETIIAKIDLYEYRFETPAPTAAFLIYDENSNEVLCLKEENPEEYITENQAKTIYNAAKNADWKRREPDVTTERRATETTC